MKPAPEEFTTKCELVLRLVESLVPDPGDRDTLLMEIEELVNGAGAEWLGCRVAFVPKEGFPDTIEGLF